MSKRANSEFGSEILEIAEQIKPFLAGRDPRIQLAVLAELLSICLAGHVVLGNPDATLELRAEILALHCNLVRQLTEVNAKMLGTL